MLSHLKRSVADFAIHPLPQFASVGSWSLLVRIPAVGPLYPPISVLPVGSQSCHPPVPGLWDEIREMIKSFRVTPKGLMQLTC